MSKYTYANKTETSSEKSRIDIEKNLKRYGARNFMYATQDNRAGIMFECNGKRVKFILVLPNQGARQFTHTPTGQPRAAHTQEKEWEQACRSKWRSLNMIIHAKLEAVKSGITVFDEEFLPYIVLPNSQTVAELMLPRIEHAYQHNTMPALIPMLEVGV